MILLDARLVLRKTRETRMSLTDIVHNKCTTLSILTPVCCFKRKRYYIAWAYNNPPKDIILHIICTFGLVAEN